MKVKKMVIYVLIFIFSFLLFSIFFPHQVHGSSSILLIWANDGGDKVTQDELRAYHNSDAVINSVWDGVEISIFGAGNEVVSFNLLLEAPLQDVDDVEVSLSYLEGPDGHSISTRTASENDLFNFVDRNIELFYIRYLEIEGLSTDLAFAGYYYDERHIPKRLQLPYNEDFEGIGVWEDRPDHNKMYPEIAVPLELESPFTIKVGTSQSIWADIYIPKAIPAGDYEGKVSITIEGAHSQEIPITLTVRGFTLPDLPSAKTMVAFSPENINNRYLNNEYPERGTEAYTKSILLQNKHFQLAHRHKLSLIGNGDFDITNGSPDDELLNAWVLRLNGDLFTPEYGYEGVGEGVGNNVFSIGTYGSWDWRRGSKNQMWENSDAWVDWFDSLNLSTSTDYFLYLIDESDNFPQIEQWAAWIESNLGPGKDLKSMATLSLPDAVSNTPSLDIPTSMGTFGLTQLWEDSLNTHTSKPSTQFYMYNGIRPATGSFATEDDGVALRVLAWGQYKMRVDRWFYWESTYYNNFQAGTGESNVYRTAQTYGSFDDDDHLYGKTGWNYFNGDGVLFYPGTDLQFTAENYGTDGPIVSLRMKHWRRGIQDVDYLTLASKIDPVRTAEIVEEMIPSVLWEVGCENYRGKCDGWVMSDISWSINPDIWEAARVELADIIEGNSPLPEPTPTPIEPSPEPTPTPEPQPQQPGWINGFEVDSVILGLIISIILPWLLMRHTRLD